MDQEREDYAEGPPPPWWLPSYQTLMLGAAAGMALAVLASANSVRLLWDVWRFVMAMQE
jgi:hypothetical protein